MNKAILSAAAIAVAAAVVSPKIISSNIEQSVHDAIESINKQPYYSAQLKDAKFGWFNSEGTITLSIDTNDFTTDPSQPSAPLEIDVNFKTSQGLINQAGLGLASFELDVPAAAARDVISWAEEKPLYAVKGKVGLTGGIAYTDQSAGFSLLNEGNELVVSAYSGAAETKNGKLVHKGVLPSVTFKDESQGAFTMENFTVDSVFPKNLFEILGQSSFYDSEVKMNAEKVSGQGLGTVSSLNITNLYLDAVSKVSDSKEVGDVSFSYKAQEVKVDEWVGTDLVAGFAVNNLDIEALNHINELIADLDHSDPQAANAAIQSIMTTSLLKILKVEPEINITELKGSIPEGQFDAKLNSKLVDIQSLPQNIEDPAFWLSHLNADSQVFVDKPVMQLLVKNVVSSQIANNPQAQGLTPQEIEQIVAQQTPATIQMLTAQGVLIETDSQFESRFELKDKKATLNGNPMPLPILQ